MERPGSLNRKSALPATIRSFNEISRGPKVSLSGVLLRCVKSVLAQSFFLEVCSEASLKMMRALLFIFFAEAHLLASLRGHQSDLQSTQASGAREHPPPTAAMKIGEIDRNGKRSTTKIEESHAAWHEKIRSSLSACSEAHKSEDPAEASTNMGNASGNGWAWQPGQKKYPLERKDKVALIVPVSNLRFPYFLEFLKQVESCPSFGAQADVFVGFSSAEELHKYWEDFRKLAGWQIPPEWERLSTGRSRTDRGESTAAERSHPACKTLQVKDGMSFCEENGITSVVLPNWIREKYIYGGLGLGLTRRTKKLYLAAWVRSWIFSLSKFPNVLQITFKL